MTLIRAEDWIRELKKAVQNERLTQLQALAEVFAEMEDGDHDAETEKLYYNFTRAAEAAGDAAGAAGAAARAAQEAKLREICK